MTPIIVDRYGNAGPAYRMLPLAEARKYRVSLRPPCPRVIATLMRGNSQ